VANILLDGTNWSGGYWDGAEYYINADSPGFEMNYEPEIQSGSRVSGSFNALMVDASGSPALTIRVDQLDAYVSEPLVSGSTGSFDVEVPAGASVSFFTESGTIYGLELVITPTLEPLTANNDFAATPFGVPVTIPVLDNDDFNGSPPTLEQVELTIETSPANGTLQLLPDGTVQYTPNSGFFGIDTFEYRITELPVAICISGMFICDMTQLIEVQGPYDDDTGNYGPLPAWLDPELPFTISGDDWEVSYDSGSATVQQGTPPDAFNEPDGFDATISQGADSTCITIRWNCS